VRLKKKITRNGIQSLLPSTSNVIASTMAVQQTSPVYRLVASLRIKWDTLLSVISQHLRSTSTMRLHSVGFADLETFGDRGRSPWSIDCNNFKVGASDTMDSMGGLALHEWLHWDKLFAPIAGPIREWNRNGPIVVIPPNDYGPCNAHVFKFSGRVPTANVENYVWLEVETFLQISVSARYLQIRGWRTVWKLQSYGILRSHKHWRGNCAVVNGESRG
jgi:hypothetical protein